MKFVIIREDSCNTNLPLVINTCYDNPDNLEYVEKWLSNYINNEIKSLLYMPNKQNERSISYEIQENDGGKIFSLIKKYQKTTKGYLYNNYENMYEKIFDIKVINDEESYGGVNNTMVLIDDKVNQRVIQSLEREALQVFLNDIRNAIKSKQSWNKDELLHLETQILRQLKKKLTNKIRRNIFKELSELDTKENVNVITNENANENVKEFKLEYTILNKYGKKD